MAEETRKMIVYNEYFTFGYDRFRFFCFLLFLEHLAIVPVLATGSNLFLSDHDDPFVVINLGVSLLIMRHGMPKPLVLTCAVLGTTREFNALWGSPLTSGRRYYILLCLMNCPKNQSFKSLS